MAIVIEKEEEYYLDPVYEYSQYDFNEKGYAVHKTLWTTAFLDRSEIVYIKKRLEKDLASIKNSLELLDILGVSDKAIQDGNNEREDNYRKSIANREKALSTKDNRDHLYLLICEDLSSLKIGRSKNPVSRAKQLNVGSPYKIELLKTIKHKGDMEKDIHKKFTSLRKNSEWFEYSDEIIDLFNNL